MKKRKEPTCKNKIKSQLYMYSVHMLIFDGFNVRKLTFDTILLDALNNVFVFLLNINAYMAFVRMMPFIVRENQ